MEDDLAQTRDDSDGELDIDSDSQDDLESAMQEALEAVEKASQDLNTNDVDDVEPSTDRGAFESSEDADIVRLQKEIADLKDRSVRTLADFDNYRKRVDREREEDRKYAAFDIMRDFLAVIDNLERALAADGPDEDLKVGVELIYRQMKDLMKKSGVERIAAVGEEFDPRFHEAVTHHQDPGVDLPIVSGELQAGYLMHSRLLRPSVVKVAMPAEDVPDPEPTSES